MKIYKSMVLADDAPSPSKRPASRLSDDDEAASSRKTRKTHNGELPDVEATEVPVEVPSSGARASRPESRLFTHLLHSLANAFS